jgi:hypothetical protein
LRPIRWLGRGFSAVQRRFWGTGGLSWAALVFVILGTLFIVLILLSPGGWQWWMDVNTVHGQERDGVVFYSYRGQSYTADDLDSQRSGPRLVFLVPSDPSDGALKVRANQIFDWSITAGPYAVAVAFVAAGFVHKRRNQKAASSLSAGGYGSGLDEDTIHRLLARQRAEGQAPRPPGGTREGTQQS